jgi:hypothetical protein
MLLDSSKEDDPDSQETSTCEFLSSNVLDFNANSIFNVNQLSLFYTYSELNNKYNLLNFLKIRCDPHILLQTLEYYFMAWGLSDFYFSKDIKSIFESYESDFLKNVNQQKEIDGGKSKLSPLIDFKINSSDFRIIALTGKGELSDIGKVIEVDGKEVSSLNVSTIFEALLDYKNLKGMEMLASHFKLKSSSNGKINFFF